MSASAPGITSRFFRRPFELISGAELPSAYRVSINRNQPQVWTMDKEHIKGAADKMKGSVKDTVGKVTGDTKMQAEGKLDKAKGSARNVVGDVKDAARDATDND